MGCERFHTGARGAGLFRPAPLRCVRLPLPWLLARPLLRRFVVNELGDLQLAGWWVGQSSLRVTARYERERAERLDEARERLDRKEMAGDDRGVPLTSSQMGNGFCTGLG